MKTASIQFNPVIGDVERNLAYMTDSIAQCASQGVKLTVFPELANTGYVFTDRDEAMALSEDVPDGTTTRAIAAACAKTGMHAVFGITERDGKQLYNSAAVVGPDGHIGTFRKLHLWDQENRIFEPGDELRVYDTAIGRLGVLICYDIWFPEAFRTLALAGAELICVPTNWVPLPAGNGPHDLAMANVLCMSNAHSNGIPVVAADRCGTERGIEFLGRSLIVDHTGWPVAGPASATEAEALVADVDLSKIEPGRSWNEFNNPLANRRTDAYVLPDA